MDLSKRFAVFKVRTKAVLLFQMTISFVLYAREKVLSAGYA